MLCACTMSYTQLWNSTSQAYHESGCHYVAPLQKLYSKYKKGKMKLLRTPSQTISRICWNQFFDIILRPEDKATSEDFIDFYTSLSTWRQNIIERTPRLVKWVTAGNACLSKLNIFTLSVRHEILVIPNRLREWIANRNSGKKKLNGSEKNKRK